MKSCFLAMVCTGAGLSALALVYLALLPLLGKRYGPRGLYRVWVVVLAGLPQAPSVYASSPALAHKRARVVLQRMVDCHKLTQDAAAQLSAETDVIPFITRSIA